MLQFLSEYWFVFWFAFLFCGFMAVNLLRKAQSSLFATVFDASGKDMPFSTVQSNMQKMAKKTGAYLIFGYFALAFGLVAVFSTAIMLIDYYKK